jgi:hypothetical protein
MTPRLTLSIADLPADISAWRFNRIQDPDPQRREHRAAVTAERAAVVAWLRALAVECRSEGLVLEDYALCEAAHDIAAGRHRPGGDP